MTGRYSGILGATLVRAGRRVDAAVCPGRRAPLSGSSKLRPLDSRHEVSAGRSRPRVTSRGLAPRRRTEELCRMALSNS